MVRQPLVHMKHQELLIFLYHLPMHTIQLGPGRTLVEQIRNGMRTAILDGRLPAGSRLPSWRDLAAQLGVSRGTVRAAYEGLIDEALIHSAGAAGSFVSRVKAAQPAIPPDTGHPLPDFYHGFALPARVFQLGVPAQDAFPYKTWSRVMTRAVRQTSGWPATYPDPRGDPGLRQELAAYLSLARGMVCDASQIFITSGFSGALGLVLHALQLHGRQAWVEDPGFPVSRRALHYGGMLTAAIPVDAEGLDVQAGRQLAPAAALALVTPGQQSPAGVTLSLARRQQLLDWAADSNAWILEDDYLSELQLSGRAAPALASLDRSGRVIHLGSFSKTLSPALRLGFVVVPPALAQGFGDAAAMLAPAPNTAIQQAVMAFMHEGQYLRHLRRMKRLYRERRDLLLSLLPAEWQARAVGALAVLLPLPDGARDTAIAQACQPQGLSPVPLSVWHTAQPRAGLLLGVTNVLPEHIQGQITTLRTLIANHG